MSIVLDLFLIYDTISHMEAFMLKLITKDGREVEVYVSGKYEDDLEIEGSYIDNGDPIKEDDLFFLYDRYSDEIFLEWHEDMRGRYEDDIER